MFVHSAAPLRVPEPGHGAKRPAALRLHRTDAWVLSARNSSRQPAGLFIFLPSFPRGRAKTKGSICEYPLKCSRFCSSVFSRAASRTRRRTTSIPPSIISPHRITLKRISTAWCGGAHRAVGTPYVFGGESLAGFDCSGLVRWTYKSVGINLPRTAREQSLMGYRIMDVSKMRAGDIVAFRRSGGGYHTGIYIGDGRFIHAPRTNSRVRVESCDSAFFRNNFIGARRIIMTGSNRAMTEVAELEDMDRPSRQSVRRGHGRSVKHSASRTRSSKASRSHRRSKRR